jgi:alpha-beta hydrolase superfamily lysophospholipase
MAAGLMLSTFQSSNLEASAYARPLQTLGAVTEYSIDDGGAPVLASWKAEGVRPKAIFLAIHGFGFQKYAFRSFAESMRLRGISTYALDIRGFGGWANGVRTDRSLHLDRALADIKETLLDLKVENPKTPIFILGESLGGALALRAAKDSPDLIAGVVSSVPSGQLFSKKALAMRLTLRYLLHAGKSIDIGQQVMARATSDETLSSKWLADSKTRMKVAKGELLQYSRFMNNSHGVARRLSGTAVLMLQGAQDKLVKPEGTVHLYRELATRDKSMVMVAGGEHLLLEEGQFDESLLNRVSAWVDDHASSQDALVANNN